MDYKDHITFKAHFQWQEAGGAMQQTSHSHRKFNRLSRRDNLLNLFGGNYGHRGNRAPIL